MRATSDRGRLEAALGAAKLTASGTRFGPALKLAESILARSTLQRREAMLISDFQKTGWSGAGRRALPRRHRRSRRCRWPTDTVANLAVPSVSFARASFSNQERITVTAGVANKSGDAGTNVPVTLEIDGRVIETLPVNVGANASASVAFSPFTLAEPALHGVVQAPAPTRCRPTTLSTSSLTPSQSVSILVVDSGDAATRASTSPGRSASATRRPSRSKSCRPAGSRRRCSRGGPSSS